MGVCDDWPYILMAQKLAATGHIVYNGWAAPLIGWQLYLGAAFVNLFGMSLTAVRMSTLLVAMVLAFVLQRTLVRANIRERNATLATLAFVLSPLYLVLPYVFTPSQLRVLIASATSSQCQLNDSCVIDSRTLPTLVIVACAVGATPGELRGLKRKDLQLRRKLLRIQRARSQQIRNVPIGSDLCALLASFSIWRFGTKTANDHLFATKQGKPLSPNQISFTFTRLCKVAGVERQDGLPHNPRLLDLRNTFAVHRVAAWIEAGVDLDRMLPVLAAYMGMDNLPSSERYLRRTPERFREPLLLLSPRKHTTQWRDDPRLITFLSKL
jgi:integrase